MSRLLHAAARGARIQAEWEGTWSGVAGVRLNSGHTYRIHPDDAHLQYGPISSALREFAEDPPKELGHFGRRVMACLIAEWMDASDTFYSWSHARQQSLFLLILAEALADEGM